MGDNNFFLHLGNFLRALTPPNGGQIITTENSILPNNPTERDSVRNRGVYGPETCYLKLGQVLVPVIVDSGGYIAALVKEPYIPLIKADSKYSNLPRLELVRNERVFYSIGQFFSRMPGSNTDSTIEELVERVESASDQIKKREISSPSTFMSPQGLSTQLSLFSESKEPSLGG